MTSCDECNAILDALRSACGRSFAEAGARETHESFMQMLRNPDESAPIVNLSPPKPPMLSPKCSEAWARLFQHQTRTGHAPLVGLAKQARVLGSLGSVRKAILEQGFAIIPEVLSHAEIGRLCAGIVHQPMHRSRAGVRHAMKFASVAEMAGCPRLIEIARAILGEGAVPFRATIFDKSLTSNWLVAWHQDTALPLRERREAEGWGPWSVKDGVTYAHAPARALEQVVALRIHLDNSTAENGPLRVLPGTHAIGLLGDGAIHDLAERIPAVDCVVPRGGIVAMRPLVVHASPKSQSSEPRRVLHIEYAASRTTADRFELAIAQSCRSRGSRGALVVSSAENSANMNKLAFGKTKDGTAADLYVLTNKNGVEASITNYGATLVGVKTPDRGGNFADITAGFDDVAGYEAGRSYFGATVGRYANRIAHGEFTLDGVKYTLAKNNGANHLHGGDYGFNKRWWSVQGIHAGPERVQMRYVSEDGEEGYPGNLTVKVEYALTDENELRIDLEAITDKATVLNLTNHSYFNLAIAGEILDHELTINATHFLPSDKAQIPTGEIRSVEGTPFDFRRQTPLGARINSSDEQMKIGAGYDHCYVLDKGSRQGPVLAARAFDPKTGRVIEVSTTEPGMQLYTGNHLDGTGRGKGRTYTFRTGFCLEVQHFPDSPNHPSFPTTVLRPGQTFGSQTIYKFSTM
ncbi:MAG TPA: galactose-1-epimerase [Candidatus Acidoferrum sp.]|nr:galactose-1-epimerase [Candidatus Acidoferrum sp.]